MNAEKVARYNIIRGYLKSDEMHTIRRNVTLAEAQKHCKDPETSSSTCTKPEGKARTERFGPWFDRYTEV